MNGGTPFRDEIKRTLRNLVIATVVVYLALIGLGVFAWIDSGNRREDLEQVAVSTNSALCALRVDLERRVENSQQFLEDNPDGIPGLSADVIQQGINNQLDTIEALSGLDCSP